MTTRTDWRALGPGRELDAVVAERVVGEVFAHAPCGDGLTRTNIVSAATMAEADEMIRSGYAKAVAGGMKLWPAEYIGPEYSTRDAEAIPLLDKHSPRVRIARDSRDHAWMVTLEMNDVVPDVAGEGDGIAEAICYAMLARQAALAALDSETENA